MTSSLSNSTRSFQTFTDADHRRLLEAGIAPEKAEEHLRLLRGGMHPPRLLRPATVGDGIEVLDPDAYEALGRAFQQACVEGRWIHFIPASGAATRLAQSLEELSSMEEKLKAEGKDSAKLRKLLGDPEALKNLPKALMPFHEVSGAVRTPLEEHIREAAALAPGAEARLHFTIAPEHEARFLAEVDRVLKLLHRENIRAEVTHSFQDPSTQTLALDSEGLPFRDVDGNLVLRPGGHGSLLRNLEAAARGVGNGVAKKSGADFAWIRNIDNIPVERLRAEGRPLRRALGGLLMQREEAQRDAARESENGLSRPVRVCGMVQNRGEIGGGPFWVQRAVESEGITEFTATPGIDPAAPAASVRIVESAEVSPDAEQQRIFRSGTHFNPVDLACSLRAANGEAFRLEDFADPAACFIAEKTHGGRALRALEWPGLWNGAMANWETHCVEIPLSQFAPVKVVADLLRPEHQEPVD